MSCSLGASRLHHPAPTLFPRAALVPGPGQDGHGTWGLLPEGCGRCEMLPCPLNAGSGALLRPAMAQGRGLSSVEQRWFYSCDLGEIGAE